MAARSRSHSVAVSFGFAPCGRVALVAHEVRRRELVLRSAQILVEHADAGMGLSDLLGHLRTSKSTFHRIVGTVRDLHVLIGEVVAGELIAHAEDLVQSEELTVGSLLALGRLGVELAVRSPESCWVLFNSPHCAEPTSGPLSRVYKAIETCIDEGQSLGIILPGDSASLAEVLAGSALLLPAQLLVKRTVGAALIKDHLDQSLVAFCGAIENPNARNAAQLANSERQLSADMSTQEVPRRTLAATVRRHLGLPQSFEGERLVRDALDSGFGAVDIHNRNFDEDRLMEELRVDYSLGNRRPRVVSVEFETIVDEGGLIITIVSELHRAEPLDDSQVRSVLIQRRDSSNPRGALLLACLQFN